MTNQEREKLAEHVGHQVVISDYKPGEPMDDDPSRFCLECIDCEEILLGSRTLVGTCKAISVTIEKGKP